MICPILAAVDLAKRGTVVVGSVLIGLALALTYPGDSNLDELAIRRGAER